jgi:kynurenine 3-monooxygenase
MLMALANLDGSFTGTLFMPFEGNNSFQNLKDSTDLVQFFSTHFPDTKQVLPNLVTDFFANPTSYLAIMKCYPWTYEDKVALIGDASHAIVPFYGHGMNAGFEDITILNECMLKYGDDWKAIFEAYQKSRKPNADAISELSRRNFVEMSSKTADPNFLLQKKIENWFSDKHPDLWMPLYSRVTFSEQPYAEALAIGDFQNKIMEQVMKMDNIAQKWNTQEVEDLIFQLLQNQEAL